MARGLTGFYREANEAGFHLIHACLGQVGTVLDSPHSTCLLDQASLRGASRKLAGIYFPFQKALEFLCSETHQATAMTDLENHI